MFGYPQELNTHTQRNKREEREKEKGTSTFAGHQKEVTNYFSSDRKTLSVVGLFLKSHRELRKERHFLVRRIWIYQQKLKQKYLPLRPTLFFPGCAAQKAAEYI